MQSLGTFNRYVRQILARPVRYYLADRALNTLVIYAAIKIIVLVAALLVALIATQYNHSMPVFPTSITRWDGQWYLSIARSNYVERYPYSAAFPPLYPVVIKLLSLNRPSSMPWVAVIISNACSFIALYFLYRLVPLVINVRYRLQVCFAFMVFPALIVCTFVAYSEGLFLALTIGAYLFWKQDRFGLAAALAIGSVFTRQVGILILVIFSCAMFHEFWLKHDTKRVLRQLAATVATTAGVGALYLFYYVRFGSPFIVSQVEASRWNQTFSAYDVVQNLRLSFLGHDRITSVVPTDAIHTPVPLIAIGALILVATVICLYKRDVALAAYSLLSLLLFLSMARPWSFVRYVAATFPLYLFFGLMLYKDWRKNLIIGSIAVAVAIQNLYIFLSGAWLY
jgi:hypothetical protein